MKYLSAVSKAEATARMYHLGGVPVRSLGPGSKEKKSSLEALGAFVGLDLAGVATKTECGRRIADVVGARWDERCSSTGDTITLEGLNRLLDAAVMWGLRQPDRMPRGSIDQLIAVEPAPRSNEVIREIAVTIEIDEIKGDIAERIAELTEVTETPDGVPTSARQVSSGDISFEDGSWRGHLLAVSDWLRLALDYSNIEEFDVTLAASLGLDASAATMPEVLFPRLAERLERALELRAAFLEDLEESAEGGATIGTATKAWLAKWEEAEEEDDAETSGSIDAEADTWPIQDFVQYARDSALNLSPSYQRADVWGTRDSQSLIESILRGIPLPSVILLSYDEEGVGTNYEVVDGKQRLTSILRFIGHHPRAVETVRKKAEEWGIPTLLDLFQTDYPAFRKVWKKNSPESLTAAKERDLYFPFPLRTGDVTGLGGPLEALRGKYYSQIRETPIKVAGANHKIRVLFEQTSKYKIPVILYKEATSDQVHEVFSLYNKQGKHLNAEEIRNALYHRLDLMLAVLVTAGDSSEQKQVAGFLSPSWSSLKEVGPTLEHYGFSTSGYKRSKLISWVLSVLLNDDPKFASRSTASQINAFFKDVKELPSHPLRQQHVVTKAMATFHAAVEAHAAMDEVWAPQFKNSLGGAKWQELQLVPTLIGLAVASTVLGGGLADRLDEVSDEIHRRSHSEAWERPAKTQTKMQWEHIARVTGELLDIIGIGTDEADDAVRQAFGRSGVGHLLAIRATGAN